MSESRTNTTELERRGERLYPSRGTRLFWVLSELRRTYEGIIRRHVTDGGLAAIDYGCGNMPYRPLFERMVCSYSGYDFAGNDLATADLTDDGRLPLDSVSVDLVVSSQVLEHVTDVGHYLAESHRVLRSRGLLILSTHGVWRYHPDPTDFWRWTGDGLRKVLNENGFEIVETNGIVGPAATGIQIFQDAVMHRVPRFLKGGFIRTCQCAMAYFDRRCSEKIKQNDACVFVCVARKTESETSHDAPDE